MKKEIGKWFILDDGRKIGGFKKGKMYVANCISHFEITPSLVINHKKKKYKCLGCGIYGTLDEIKI